MPLCLECVGRVREEVEATLKEVDAECEAYQAGLDRLSQEPCRSMPQEVIAHSEFSTCTARNGVD
jgi:hypothetical protein